LFSLIEDVLSDLRQCAKEKRIALTIDIPDPSIAMVADAALLRAALYQLVLNGINYGTPDGYVRVEASESAGQVFIGVSDSGIGIAQSDLETIYRPFFQVESHDTRRVGGLGLGLSIVQRAVAQLGGAITVDSTLGKGTTFKLQLPLRQPSSETDLLALREQLDNSHQQSLAYARDIQLLYRRAQQANKDLLDVNARLEAANRLKASLLNVLSSELHSPFAAIDSVLQNLSRSGIENLRQEQRVLLAQLANHVADAHRLIDRLAADASLLSQPWGGLTSKE
jgi:signal transduction histidine kinase